MTFSKHLQICFWPTGWRFLLYGACCGRSVLLDLLLPACAPAHVVLSWGWMHGYQGNMEGSGGCWLLWTSSQTHWGTAGHFYDQTPHHGICHKVNQGRIHWLECHFCSCWNTEGNALIAALFLKDPMKWKITFSPGYLMSLEVLYSYEPICQINWKI